MKKINFAAGAAIIVAAGLVASACSSDTDDARTNTAKDNVVRVVTSVDNMPTRGSYNSENIKNSEIGLSILNSANSGYTYPNIKLTNNGTTWKPAERMLWQNKETAVSIVAYAPYRTGYDERGTSLAQVTDFPVSVQTTQTADDNKSDFLAYKATGFLPTDENLVNGAVPVNFRHILSRLDITVKFGTEFDQSTKLTDSPIAEGSLAIGGTKTNGRFDFTKEGDITAGITATGNAANVQPYKVPGSFTAATGNEGHEVTNAGVVYRCILIPQTVEANTFIVSFIINGMAYSWTAPSPITLAAGKVNTLELTVGKDVVVPGAFSVNAWNDKGTTTIYTD